METGGKDINADYNNFTFKFNCHKSMAILSIPKESKNRLVCKQLIYLTGTETYQQYY